MMDRVYVDGKGSPSGRRPVEGSSDRGAFRPFRMKGGIPPEDADGLSRRVHGKIRLRPKSDEEAAMKSIIAPRSARGAWGAPHPEGKRMEKR